jgi:PAS domain S-box-containing protein
MTWGTHFCHFYETKQDLLDILIPYFKAGLESKEYCLWVVSDSEVITVEEAKRALAQAVPDLGRHLADENIEILDGHDWYFEKDALNLEKVKNAWDAKLKRALARGYDGLRASADTFWLTEKDCKDFFVYENQVNDWITHQTMTVLCTYPLAKIGAGNVLDVVQAHQFAIARRQGEWEVIESPELRKAKDEIKRLNEEIQRLKERTPKQPLILSYGVAVLSVSAALILTLWLRMEVGQESTPIVGLFLCAVMLSAWFGGVWPGLLATALSLLAFVYYFAAPFYSWAVEIKEIPRLLVFTLSALFIGCLSAAQRSKAETLRRARDVLDETVQEVKRTNVALRAEITERKHAEALLHAKEQEFRAIVENAPDQIIRYDRDFRRVYVNPAMARFYGLPAETLIDKPLGSGIPEAGLKVKEDELAQVRQKIAAVFNTGKSYDYELAWTMPTGRSYFSIRLFPELDLNGSVVNVLGISRDITERKQAEEKLRATSEQLRSLSASLQSAREEEGTRIAREIHDELGSALTSLKWELESFDKVISESGKQSQLQVLRERIEAMLRLTETTIGSIRRISSELRPSVLDDLGLIEAIEWQAEQFQARAGIIVHCDCPLESEDLTQEQSTAIFRVFQETLTNVLRHAQATRVDITARKEAGEFVLTINDNGRGITEDEQSGSLSLGLLGMRERANLIGATIQITGVDGKGTVVTIRVPISG